MPFRELGRLEQRVAMLMDYDTGAFSVSYLCGVYGVSRETFYVWLRRRQAGEADWFVDRSHAPGRCPHRTGAEVAEAVVAMKRRFPRFGPKKVLARLRREAPAGAWPAASTIGDILKQAGLVDARSGRRRRLDQGAEVKAWPALPNAEWACDFKGWFRTRDGRRCDPLTITDTASRYLIALQICEPSIEAVKPVFERAFSTCGLPGAIRCDNGSPFGSSGAGGLTRLSLWWLKLGIEPRFIPPASPQHNSRHERMHRTLKEQTSAPAAASLAQQQDRFDRFRRHYNTQRPHEALDQQPPASLWTPSPRSMPDAPAKPWYDANHQVRRVRTAGEIKWNGQLVFIGEALQGESVGIAQREDRSHLVRFGDIDLGVIDHRGHFRRFAPRRHRLREAAQDQHPTKLSGIIPV